MSKSTNLIKRILEERVRKVFKVGLMKPKPRGPKRDSKASLEKALKSWEEPEKPKKPKGK